jgi:signal transduction histidine kinase
MIVFVVFSYICLLRAIFRQKSLDEIKSDFVNNMTHELKTPISVAYAVTDALLNFGIIDDPEKRKEYLNVSKEQLMRLNGLVEQILTMSVEERKNLKLLPESLSVHDLFQQLEGQYLLNTQKNLAFEIKVDPEGLSIDADKVHFQNVIGNLIENSIKYSGESVLIKLLAEEKDDHIVISIEDNGFGIPSASLSKIFDRFYRVPTGDIHQAKGYGLGLYYVKTILEKHGWTIKVDSREGKGTTFRIII